MARKGETTPEEVKKKLSLALQGRIISLETREKISSTRKRKYETGEIPRKVLYRGKDFRWYINCRGGKHEAWTRIVYQNTYLNGKEIPNGYDIHHKDKNPENDIPENLEIETRSEHSKLHFSPEIVFSESSRRNNSETKKGSKNPNWGKIHSSETREKISSNVPRGEKHYKAKLKEEDVISIKQFINKGVSLSKIAHMFSVSPATILQIKTGKSWKRVVI